MHGLPYKLLIKSTNIMRKIKYQLDRLSLEVIYTSFIRPILEFDDILFDKPKYDHNCKYYYFG